MPDERDFPQAEPVEHAENIVAHELERIRSRPVTIAVATKIEGEYTKEFSEPRRHRCPAAATIAQCVQQYHRRSIRSTSDVISKVNPASTHPTFRMHQSKIQPHLRSRVSVDDHGGQQEQKPRG